MTRNAFESVSITTTVPFQSSTDLLSPNNTIRQRGLLDISPSKTSAPNLPFQFGSSTRKHWRWWNYLFLLVGALSCIEFILFLVSSTLLTNASEPITFTLRNYPKLPYQPLDTTTSIDLPSDSEVYHVTKEFGPATMGGMGMILTAITQAQLQTGKITPYVVLPFYSFLKKQEQYAIKKTVDLVITIRNERGEPEAVEFKVSELKYDFNPIDDFELLTEEEKFEITSSTVKSKTVKIYLIGPAKSGPLKKAFRANTITEIYSSPKGLPQEWKDQYFVKAVASFLTWKAAGKHEQSLFAPLNVSQPRVDIVHLHGATNAYVTKYLTEYERQMGSTPPTVVYTLHDYLDELQYTNALGNVQKFLNAPRAGHTIEQDIQDILKPYTFGKDRTFMSPMAIDLADMVTFVSASMAKDMIEGRLNFYLKEVVMDNLLQKAKAGKFYGISNGLDFTSSINPFTETKLIEHELDYPAFAKFMIETKLETGLIGNDWTLSTEKLDFVTESKRRAKQYLVEQGLLLASDINRPLVLFVGRFQYNKGLETFEDAARLFKSHDMKFAIIGQPNNYPLKWVERLASNYPEDIVLMTQIDEQRDWLIYFRAAADFVYVPSITESFGLVAVEGLMFGSSVISTGTGGMAEFLIDRQVDEDTLTVQIDGSYIQSDYQFNAYLFDLSVPDQLSKAIGRAAKDYQYIKQDIMLHEEYILRMMMSAYALGWDRGNDQGPVYDYLRVYQKAIQEKRESSSFK
ncbi:hypothetical protein EDC94DRAFT_563864 [Helicostylum pulchrum]|nr:hypothetical protein EDC94DRAFT_563864 [Helicostylum pulchrum]